MSDKPESPPRKKRGLVRKLVLFGAVPLLLVGGGIGAGVFAAGRGLVGGRDRGPAEDPNRPKLVPRDGVHAPAGRSAAAAPDAAFYKSTYYPIEQPFTSNLRDTDGFLQLGLGVSTFYDGKVVDNLKDSDMPVRSAVLEVLAQQDAEVLNTPDGKLRLRRALKDAINRVLNQRTGFGGIDDVYFTSFIIQ